jgi:flagellar basal body-associated protein FliL
MHTVWHATKSRISIKRRVLVSTNDDLAKLTAPKEKGTPTGKEIGEKKFILLSESKLPIDKNTLAPNTSPKEIKKKLNIVPLILLCVTLIIVTIFTVYIIFSGPDPEVVTFSGGDLNASLFDFKCQVHATVKNNGNSGDVIVNFKVTQNNHTFDRNKKLFLKAGQQKDIMEEFTEVDMTGTNPEYIVTAKAK